MPPALALHALGLGLIGVNCLLALILLLLLLLAREYHEGEPVRGIVPFTAALLGLCAVIALTRISVRADKVADIEPGFHRANVSDEAIK